MMWTDDNLRVFADAVRRSGHPDSWLLLLFPDGSIRAFSASPDAYHVFREEDFR